MKTYDVYLGLGSNRGEREKMFTRAVQELRSTEGTRVIRVSPVYETEPYGKKDQPGFLNAAVHIETIHPPAELLKRIKEIETRLGRVTTERWGPREIDIDILVYDGLVHKADGLTVPHEDLENRNFALVPLMDIEPDLVHPVNGMTIEELARNCKMTGRVVRSIHIIKY